MGESLGTWRRYRVAIIGCIVGAALAVGLAVSGGLGDTSGNGSGEVEAIRQCEGFAGKRLKSPASAEYDLTATRDGGQWVVTGTVDSQNGFGAMIRSNVECRITLTDDLATLEAITVD